MTDLHILLTGNCSKEHRTKADQHLPLLKKTREQYVLARRLQKGNLRYEFNLVIHIGRKTPGEGGS